MSALPPDATRLHAILSFLDKQIADNEAVGIYLRLQRDAVRQAIARAEVQQSNPQAPQQPSPAVLRASTSSRRQGSTGFSVEQQPRALGPEPVRIHTDDCGHGGVKHPISAHDARAALIDPQVEACPFCRPDDVLGLDLD
ncbi:DUF6233 domain-containing protein [Streptomyces sp. Marseille-Q5077]|uniref:DUF6233 domain-containing protein n=1 Tax=Streptomyces sp. Marseille-Q5077 TaxID=3418995 RepID=UPI003CFF70F4